MVLELAWFVTLTILGVLCFVLFVFFEGEDEKDMNDMGWFFGGIGALVLALVISSNSTVTRLFNWCLRVLPEQGTEIHQATAVVLTGAACLAFVVGPALAGWRVRWWRESKKTEG